MYYEFPWIQDVVTMETILERYHMADVRRVYYELQKLFFASISDKNDVVNNVYRGGNRQACIDNIKKIINYMEDKCSAD